MKLFSKIVFHKSKAVVVVSKVFRWAFRAFNVCGLQAYFSIFSMMILLSFGYKNLFYG